MNDDKWHHVAVVVPLAVATLGDVKYYMGIVLPFGVSEAMSAGYEYGKKAQSLPAFTEGQNKGMEERRTGRNLKLNPYNRISQSFEHLTWEAGYQRGNLLGDN